MTFACARPDGRGHERTSAARVRTGHIPAHPSQRTRSLAGDLRKDKAHSMNCKRIGTSALAVVALLAAGPVLAAPPAGAAVSDKEIVKLSKDKAAMAKAQQTFSMNCAACHAAQGQGLIGPNLTDNAWLKGGKPSSIFKSIADGAPAKGMPPQLPTLGTDGVKQLAAYVVTLKGKNVPGKPPEGTVEK